MENCSEMSMSQISSIKFYVIIFDLNIFLNNKPTWEIGSIRVLEVFT